MSARIRVLGIVLLIVLSASGVQAATPPALPDIHARIDRIVALLQAPTLTHEERRRAVLAEAEPAFDWREMARAALGPSWHERTAAERAEFTRLFQALVERAYLTRVLRYHGEKVVYGREAVQGDAALLPTRILRPNGAPISVDYELLHRGDRWLVTDILVEHVGLVNNYRSQFAAILGRSSYRQLIARMRARISAPA
jgi:phospholipid transport system substrate-binding protein